MSNRKSHIAILSELGLIINNDQSMLQEARTLYKESLALPQGSDVSSVNRRWFGKATNLTARAWHEAAKYYEHNELGYSIPGTMSRLSKCGKYHMHSIFDHIYVEAP